jgi:hypothetical protein
MPVDRPMTKVITNHLMTHLKMKIFQNSEGWLYCFRTRKGISMHKMSAELAAFGTSPQCKQHMYMCKIYSIWTSLCVMSVKKFRYKLLHFSHTCMQQIMGRLWEIVCRIWVELVSMQWPELGTFTHERWLLVSHQLSIQQGM